MDIFKQSGITRAELGRRFGLHRDTVAAWGDKLPGYAIVYLDLLIQHNNMRHIIGEAIR